MANPPRSRKRVHAVTVRRAPDGSAFEKCDGCGVIVPVALADMHECETKKEVKKFKGVVNKPIVVKQSYCDQVRSPFRFFMERFVKTCKSGDLIDIDRKGFEIWKNMSMKEKQPYVTEVDKVNMAHERALVEEANEMLEVDDELDSAIVGKFDKDYEDHALYPSDSSEDCWMF